MWWQLKPTRLIGISGLSVAGFIGFVVVTGTVNQLSFGPSRGRGGHGHGHGGSSGGQERAGHVEQSGNPVDSVEDSRRRGRGHGERGNRSPHGRGQ